MCPSILEPASFVTAKTERLLFAIAYYIHIVGVDTLRHQIFFGGMSTTLTQSNIVIVGASFIAMTLNFYMQTLIAFEKFGISLENTF